MEEHGVSSAVRQNLCAVTLVLEAARWVSNGGTDLLTGLRPQRGDLRVVLNQAGSRAYQKHARAFMRTLANPQQ